MSHEHHHHGPTHIQDIGRAFVWGIALNTLFTLVEFVVGYMTGSLALLSDAAHNLSDVASLLISLIGMKLAQKTSNTLFTYGYKKASILASLINAILLVWIVLGIIKEAIERFSEPPELAGINIMIVAGIGVLINAFSAYLFFKNQQDDINIRGAFLHLLVDALVSLGVVVSGLIIYYTHWNLVDSWVSIFIALIILVSTWGLLKESIRLALDAVPQNIHYAEIKRIMEEVEGVLEVHHLHIWALSSTENGLTSHVRIKDSNKNSWQKIKSAIKHELLHNKIGHITLELEGASEPCAEEDC